MGNLDEQFWDDRYNSGKTGWDIGFASTPLVHYIDQIKNKDLRILVPGAGNGYEVIYLVENGFTDVSVIDISGVAIQNIDKRLPDGHKVHLIRDDFFNHQGSYDIILEQTFFCALDPSLRFSYVKHSLELLNDHGCIIGLLFNVNFDKKGPPFGGKREEYIKLFDPYFKIHYCDPCYNSIPPRQGAELFIKFQKS